MKTLRLPLALFALLPLLVSCGGGGGGSGGPAPDSVLQLGERLFLETRFAQFFAAANGVAVNAPLAAGDPTVAESQTLGAPLPGPFADLSMNCRACHLVDEQLDARGGGMRAYADFAERSPVPPRPDGRTRASRNSPPLVDASLARARPALFHFDGEFGSLEDLVAGTISGRNYGWLPGERAQAVAQVAAVIRGDDGMGSLASGFGALSYAAAFNPPAWVPPDLVIPPSFRVNVLTASDEEVFAAVARFIAAYVRSLEFARDENGEFSGSPYDAFLALNGLPRAPETGETELEYARRLRGLLDALVSPVFVTTAEGSFEFHEQDFIFGALELEGLKIFLREPATLPPTAQELAQGGIGNCVACHHPPAFTDFGFHNVGTAQSDYDDVHGAGSFAMLAIPGLAERKQFSQTYLPPSASFPFAEGICAAIPIVSDPRACDLGLWNVCANPEIPRPQDAIAAILEGQLGAATGSMAPADLLPLTIGLFKTANLRDLGHSAPYMHTGRFPSLPDVLGHYEIFSDLARLGLVRNGDPELAGIVIAIPGNIDALLAFLRALNEDYS